MCNRACIVFGAKSVAPSDVAGRRVIEVGSVDVNGSLRPIFEAWEPGEYVGIDLHEGPGVDRICSAEEMIETFGPNSFDLVIATELIEHVRDWRKVISNIKNVCRPNGVMLVTTPSPGFPYHAYPHDFWRYDSTDIEQIFSDCVIEILESDAEAVEVFAKVRKPEGFVENDLSAHELYSVVVRRRIRDVDEAILKREGRKKIIFDKGVRRFLAIVTLMTRGVLKIL